MFLSNAIKLVDQYYGLVNPDEASKAAHVVAELRVRLRQMSYLYREVKRLNSELLGQDGQGPRDQPGNCSVVVVTTFMHSASGARSENESAGSRRNDRLRSDEKLQLQLEAFYYIAHRVRKLLQKSRRRLPGLGRFECESIARIRNNLIEHPDKQDGTETMTLQVSSHGGPSLKGAKRAHEIKSYRDEGFFANARHFRDNLEDVLQQAISARQRS